MSVNKEKFLEFLKFKLKSLTWKEKIHVINRLYEKVRLIHNAVGDVYARRKTIQQFKKEYPKAFDKLKATLLPYIKNNYLSEEGWMHFLETVFDVLHDVIVSERSKLVAEIEEFSDNEKTDLLNKNFIVEVPKPVSGGGETTILLDNSVDLRQTVSEHEFDPFEVV